METILCSVARCECTIAEKSHAYRRINMRCRFAVSFEWTVISYLLWNTPVLTFQLGRGLMDIFAVPEDVATVSRREVHLPVSTSQAECSVKVRTFCCFLVSTFLAFSTSTPQVHATNTNIAQKELEFPSFCFHPPPSPSCRWTQHSCLIGPIILISLSAAAVATRLVTRWSSAHLRTTS
jgi:hypothetical protein